MSLLFRILSSILFFMTTVSICNVNAQKIDAYSETSVDTVIKAVYWGGLGPSSCLGNNGRAIFAQSPCAMAIEAVSLDFTALKALSFNSNGIIGESGLFGTGVTGISQSGNGVVGTGGDYGGVFSGGFFDVELKGATGEIKTDNSETSSDMILIANDKVVVELDNDNEVNEVSSFEVNDGENNQVLSISENASFSAGRDCQANGFNSVAMGKMNTASADASFVVGSENTSSGLSSFASGNQTIADGNYSTAMGRLVDINNNNGSIVIGDSDPNSEGVTIVGKTDEFVARFWNGYYFMTSGDNVRTGIVAGRGANAWSSISDIHRKEKFQTLDDEEILEKLSSVEYSSWNYKGQDPKTFRHYGIMAQEFYNLFGKDDYGTIGNDTLVNPIDMLGITMSAIKGAKIKIDHLESENEALKRRLEAIEKKLSEIERSSK